MIKKIIQQEKQKAPFRRFETCCCGYLSRNGRGYAEVV